MSNPIIEVRNLSISFSTQNGEVGAVRDASFKIDAGETFGLAGESGEVAEKIKKVIRDKNSEIDEETRLALKKELGDVFWYIAALCDEVGLDMEDVAESNINKLLDRQQRNVLHGSGDNR